MGGVWQNIPTTKPLHDMMTTPTQLRAEAKILIGAEAYNEIASLNRIELSKVIAKAHFRFNDKLAKAAGKVLAAVQIEWRMT